MASQPSGDGGIFIPINLDTTGAVEQFDKFKEAVKQTDLRPNADLDAFFDNSGAAAAKAAKEIADYRKQLQELNREAKNADAKRMMGSLSAPAKFQMNMASMAAKSYRSFAPEQRGRVWSNEYQKVVGRYESARQGAYEQTFQNRYLQSELDDGSYRKQVRQTLEAERAERKLMMQRDKMLRQTRLIERQERYGRLGGLAAHLYGENADALRAAGRSAGRLGVGAGAGIAGLAASGFQGTIEGERFAREMRVLSLELAAAFKPMMDMATSVTRNIRQELQSYGPDGQNRIMHAGSSAGGAYLGYRVAGGPGALVGSAIGYGLSTSASAQEKSMYKMNEFMRAAEGMDLDTMKAHARTILDKNAMSASDQIPFYGLESRKEKESTISGLKAYEYTRRLRGLSDEDRAAEIERIRGENKKSFWDGFGKTSEKRIGNEALDKAIESIDAEKKINESRRKLMITEGTGFSGAGSTFFALQEDFIRTSASENERAYQQRQELIDEVKKLNK